MGIIYFLLELLNLLIHQTFPSKIHLPTFYSANLI